MEHEGVCMMITSYRIDKIHESSEAGADLMQTKRYFVEIGCLFVMNQGSR